MILSTNHFWYQYKPVVFGGLHMGYILLHISVVKQLYFYLRFTHGLYIIIYSGFNNLLTGKLGVWDAHSTWQVVPIYRKYTSGVYVCINI